MKRPILISVFALAAVIGVAALALLTTPPNPIAQIKVLDNAGKPVSGAIVKPYALRPKRGGADYFWTDPISVKPLPVTTDQNGIARVPFPHYIVEKLETGEISFTVDHPDFCSDSFSRDVAFAPPENAPLWQRLIHPMLVLVKKTPALPRPVNLKRGGILRVSAYLDSKDEPTLFPAVSGFDPGTGWGTPTGTNLIHVLAPPKPKLLTNLHPQVTSIDLPESNFWRDSADGSRTTQRVSEGSNLLRIAWFPGGGQIWFSDVVSFVSRPGQTNDFQLPLKPGSRLSGKLDDSVPRPITQGRAQLHVYPPGTSGEHTLYWESTRTINPDGTFVFESLPPGTVEVIAICHGFISKNGPKSTGHRTPQVFTLAAPKQDIVVAMEPTGTCEFMVLDEQDRPLRGALVAFWPNVLWGGWSSTIFARDSYNWEDVLPTGQQPDWNRILRPEDGWFEAKTDDRGVAVVENLPIVSTLQPFSANYTNYEMPINLGKDGRDDRILVQAGVTNRRTIKLQKKGTEFMQPRK